MNVLHRAGSALAAIALIPAVLAGQERTPEQWVQECREWDSDRNERHCETREYTLRSTGSLRVDAGPNGGVRVMAWNRDEVRVVAKINAQAPEMDEARGIAEQIRIETEPGRVRSDGPRLRGGRRSWSVSYDVWVPARTDLDLETTNGGLAVEGVNGRLRLGTTNGGIRLAAVSGDVHAETTNGGVDVSLEGERWQGAGLSIETTNGGVRVRVPEGYSAELEASTTNGGIDFGFPVTVEGRLTRRIRATLGNGGPALRFETTNGGIRLVR